jgi:hypothetical protein
LEATDHTDGAACGLPILRKRTSIQRAHLRSEWLVWPGLDRCWLVLGYVVRNLHFIPANGVLYGPFGWGFYSPLVVYRAPIIVGSGFYHHFGPEYAPVYAYHFHPHAHLTPPRPPTAAPHPAPTGPRAFGGFHAAGFRRPIA